MKSKFSGYYSYSNSELRGILSNSIVTLDYTLLLDINKLSYGRLLLDTLNQFSERLWLPYDTAWMYHQKIQGSIEEQIRRVDTAKMYLTSFKNAAADPMNHPYIADTLSNKYDLLMKLAIEALDKESKYLNTSLFGSDIRNKILNLFDGKIGEEYNSSDLQRVCNDGAERAAQSKPPCVNLIDSKLKREQFHYYIVWKQIQRKVLDDNKNSVVLITNRLSENWFLTYRNSVCVTSPFLRTEFEKVTGKPFFCMSAHLFIRKLMPRSGNSQEYEKLLLQLHKTPQKRKGDSTEIANNQL